MAKPTEEKKYLQPDISDLRLEEKYLQLDVSDLRLEKNYLRPELYEEALGPNVILESRILPLTERPRPRWLATIAPRGRGHNRRGREQEIAIITMNPSLIDAVRDAFPDDPATITLGAPVHEEEFEPAPLVRLSTRMMLRHGLIAGASKSGRSRTIQLLVEQLSNEGVAAVVTDPDGDLTGLGMLGEPNDEIRARAEETGYAWKRTACPIELLSFTGQLGAHARATISALGPTLLGRMVGLTATQNKALLAVFKYADANQLPLVNLEELRLLVDRFGTEPILEELEPFGAPTRVSINAVGKKLLAFEEEGYGACFGEPEMVAVDLLRAPGGRGIVSLLELSDMQSKPIVPGMLILWILARLYHELPDAPDLEMPKVVFFIEGGRYLFEKAPKAFARQILQLIRVVRSRGVGIFFVVDSPRELPPELVAQLGNRIQLAFRPSDEEEEKALRAIANSFPKSPYYDFEKVLPDLDVGEAVVSALSSTGAPTMPVVTRFVPPGSRMGPLTERELSMRIQESTTARRYGQRVEPDAAREALARKMLAGHMAIRTTSPKRVEPAPGESGVFEKVEPPTVGRGLLGAMLGTGPQPRRR